MTPATAAGSPVPSASRTLATSTRSVVPSHRAGTLYSLASIPGGTSPSMSTLAFAIAFHCFLTTSVRTA